MEEGEDTRQTEMEGALSKDVKEREGTFVSLAAIANYHMLLLLLFSR